MVPNLCTSSLLYIIIYKVQFCTLFIMINDATNIYGGKDTILYVILKKEKDIYNYNSVYYIKKREICIQLQFCTLSIMILEKLYLMLKHSKFHTHRVNTRISQKTQMYYTWCRNTPTTHYNFRLYIYVGLFYFSLM